MQYLYLLTLFVACFIISVVRVEGMLLARPTAIRLFRQCPNPRIWNSLSTQNISPAIVRFNHSNRMDMQREVDNMLSFWFDRNQRDWFLPPPGLDDEIKSRYHDLIVQARSGELDHWTKDPKGTLCLVLLLDQFPRNIFRGSGESFSSDEQALELVTKAVAQGFDTELGKISKAHQTILYMPFMHAEKLLAQIAGVALFDNLAKSCEAGTEECKAAETGVDFARKHLNCVAQLGRFPKRNGALGRPNTEEEDKYLEDHPEGF